MTLDASQAVTFEPDEAEELHWLLGQLEDWLRHASDTVVAELGEFVNPNFARGSVCHVIDTLGLYGVELRRRAEGRHR